jgi:hypothetical protein
MSRAWTLPGGICLAFCAALMAAQDVFGWSGEAIGTPMLAAMLITGFWHVKLLEQERMQRGRSGDRSPRDAPS